MSTDLQDSPCVLLHHHTRYSASNDKVMIRMALELVGVDSNGRPRRSVLPYDLYARGGSSLWLFSREWAQHPVLTTRRVITIEKIGRSCIFNNDEIRVKIGDIMMRVYVYVYYYLPMLVSSPLPISNIVFQTSLSSAFLPVTESYGFFNSALSSLQIIASTTLISLSITTAAFSSSVFVFLVLALSFFLFGNRANL